MTLFLKNDEICSRITFMGDVLSFYPKGVYYKTKLSNPQNIIVVDENQEIVTSSSVELTPDFVISDEDIKSIVEFHNRTGNLPDFYLFDKNI